MRSCTLILANGDSAHSDSRYGPAERLSRAGDSTSSWRAPSSRSPRASW